MARRGRGGRSHNPQYALVVIVLLVVGGLGFMLFRNAGDPLTGSNLDIDDYLKNGNSFRGNVYRVQGKIEEQLFWTSDRGRFYHVAVKSKRGTGHQPVAIKIPDKFREINIEREQEFVFRVKVEEGGVLVAIELKKI